MTYRFGTTNKYTYSAAPKVFDVVRINKETQPVLEDAIRECYERGINVTVGKLVSDMVAFAAKNMQFVEE